ncbi:MAG: polysaccharide pyruvyl transferase family protein [Lachnospiraceae bacterium]|nr:polysaccharide pyruvyl transferase family protein [Lachnospiraceae bacterium]
MRLTVLRNKGFKGAAKYYLKKIRSTDDTEEILVSEKKYTILLLTNRDSDNLGDQVIEACDIGLISAVMSNLNIKKRDYEIISREAAIVSRKYISTKDPALLNTARKLIEISDLIVFGGAPMFNYLYQFFYERTAVILELAKEYNKPVIFSAIGVEGYHEKNKKCQRLKKTLNFDIVKQITTRDEIDLLKKYKENEQMRIGKVSDPAVFSSAIFKRFAVKKRTFSLDFRKKVGIFILRANGFEDNKFDFSREDAAKFWVELIEQLKDRGYKYELLTSGHFGDEAFLDYLIRNYNVEARRCVFNMNTPEKLIRKIASCDAVVSCRLHPSIISFALDVPSLGVVWNTKVKGFYESVGYGDRVVNVEDINAEAVADRIEEVMKQGVVKDETYLMSIYQSLFNVMKEIFCPQGNKAEPYTYAELMRYIPQYEGTTRQEMEDKLKRKFRRTYQTYNKRFDRNYELQQKVEELKAEIKRLKESGAGQS